MFFVAYLTKRTISFSRYAHLRFPDGTKASHKNEDSFPDKMNGLIVSFKDPKCPRLTFPYFNFFFEREKVFLHFPEQDSLFQVMRM